MFRAPFSILPASVGAECIIAINEDPDAPIFGAAQYKVVGDAVEVVEELLAQLER